MLTRPHRLDVILELDLALATQDIPRIQAIATTAAERAEAEGDEAGRLLSLAVVAWAQMGFVPEAVEEIERLAHAALRLLEAAGDHAGQAWAWYALTGAANMRCRFGAYAEAAEQAVRHARLAGHDSGGDFGFGHAIVGGPRRASEALAALDRLLPGSQRPILLLNRALLLAMLDRTDEAWSIAVPAGERSREIGYGGDQKLAHLARIVGDHEAAERFLESFCEEAERLGDLSVLSSYAPMRGRALCALGRYDEAEALAQRGRELGGSDDLFTQATWREVQALVLSSRREHPEAARLAREAVTIAADSDMLELQGDTYADLAEVLQAAGRSEEAAAALHEALDRYERKEIIPLARRIREQLEAHEHAST